MEYSKTQLGWFFLSLMIIGAIATCGLLFLDLGEIYISKTALWAILISCGVAALLFYQLRVSVSEKTLLLVYGIGIIRIKINIEKLQKVEIIRNPWYYGLLIRITTEGMLYNIQGLKAVKITHVKNGTAKTFMVGTAEPEKLKKAIEKLGIVN